MFSVSSELSIQYWDALFDNKEEEEQQPELAHVHTQEHQQAHMRDHELDGAVGE